MNALIVIHPYKHLGMWVFDDEATGLIKEPFVAGADKVIDAMVCDIPKASNSFTLLFSAAPFPGWQAEFSWRREEMGGNWYFTESLNMEGWLCPALFKYFERAPEKIYAQFRAKSD
jgi:hypothetical protein